MKYLLLLIFICITFDIEFVNAQPINSDNLQQKLENLEKVYDRKIGLYAINTNNNQIISYRAEERFPVQSTLKLIAVGALLKECNHNKALLQQKIYYTKSDLIPWSPITASYLKEGMTLAQLSEAAITYS